MSTIAERARQEADEVEREDEDEAEGETPDAPEPDEPEDEPEAQAPPLPTFDPAALETEQKRHEKALAKVFDGLEAFDTCDGCGGLGIVPKGLEAAPDLTDDPKAVACDVCNGFGVLRTGSRNPQYETIPCDTCQGRGYRDREGIEAAERARQLAAQPAYTPPPPAPVWDAARGAYVDHLGQVLGGGAPMPAPGYPA